MGVAPFVGAGALAGAGTASAQSARRTYRLGWLSVGEIGKEPQHVAFVQRLGELGLVEGHSLVIERRHADNRLEMLPPMAAELARLKCDAFFGSGPEANLAALASTTRATPIVFVAVDFDPVATGDVASLARPGGRVTGITALQSALPSKRLELLREALPQADKVAVLANEQTGAQLALTRGTARRLGLSLQVIDLKRPPFDLEAGFAEAVRANAQAMLVLGSALWVPLRGDIHELARRARIPTVFHHDVWVATGGFMSYGFSFPAIWRRGAEMVAAVLRGARVGEMPMEQPTRYELVINLGTARALGLQLPQSMLIRADRVIGG
ncbi:MAG: ABC transporter substrate-binding protein [Burkholderiaceae bacterium]